MLLIDGKSANIFFQMSGRIVSLVATITTRPAVPSAERVVLGVFLGHGTGVAVAMSQKPHKVRVERSGATLGRRRVVNLTCPHGEDYT